MAEGSEKSRTHDTNSSSDVMKELDGAYTNSRFPSMVGKERSIVKGNSTRLRQIRLQLGLSQAAFAKSLGVAVNTVSRWELGTLAPPKVVELAGKYLLLTHRPKKGKKA